MRLHGEQLTHSPSAVYCTQAVQAISAKQQLAMKQKRAMDMSMAPGKSLAMNAFMMYMAGSSINIFRSVIVSVAQLLVFHLISTSVLPRVH